jgi:hypothetical protein
VAKLLQALATERLSRRLQALWGYHRARSEIAALRAEVTRRPAEHLSWVKNETRPFPQLPTTDLLQLEPYPLALATGKPGAWAADLPDATRSVVVAASRAPVHGS